MCKCNLCVFYFVIVCCGVANCYNVDTINYIKHRGPRDSMFGFSVAAHKEHGYNWILVGAPESQTGQPEVLKGGAVYRCDAQRNNSCYDVPFDTAGDHIDNQGRKLDQKSGQWFGATLHSAGTDGPIVACAPRYIWFSSKRTRRDPVGTCYVAKNGFREFSEYSPCRTSYWGYHRQGWCQAGFSAGLSDDGKRLFIGAPGSWYWQGQIYSVDAYAKFRYSPFKGSYAAGLVSQQSLESRPAVIQTRESSEMDDDSYMGYSMAVGDFTGDGTQGTAVGMPRGNQLLGKVVLFTWNLTNFRNVSGLQLGAYFGYSVAAADIDGDGRDDLIVGAPLYTIPNNEGKYEVGRVYLVYQHSSEGLYRRLETLDGVNSKSRFGLSVASLGDINLDGYGDFAVGAPYDGPRERGAVYIFHGSMTGVKKFSQVIYSEDVSSFQEPIQTFGFSLSGAVDLDDNDYPDTVVGAYLSNTVFYFRSRPVVKIEGSATFLIERKEIILEQKNCTLPNSRVPVACTTLDTCFKFHGQGVPRDIVLELQYALDVQKTKSPRMFFIDRPKQNIINETLPLRKGDNLVCRQKVVYIKHDIRDKLTPLEAEVRYSMRQKRNAQYQELLPILDFSTPPFKKDSITVHKNCGTDNICIPDLRMIIKPNVNAYLLGSNTKLILDVIVENSGEDSFETTFDVQLPEGVDFNKIIEVDKNEVRILCSQSQLENYTVVTCDIGNPLPARKIAHFKMEFKPYHKEGMKPYYEFSMYVNSTNPEDNYTLADNSLTIRLPITIDSKLELGGSSRPTEIRYNTSYYTTKTIKRESDIGPQVIHIYTIRNNGPSSINEAEMLFIWPYATEGGKDLMYLLEQPHTTDNVKCEAAEANYMGYTLDYRKKTIWETLDIDVTKGEFYTAGKTSTGVIIEEGVVTTGTTSNKVEKHRVNKVEVDQSSGDASYIHQQRHKGTQEKTVSGERVLVTQDSGSGSEVHPITAYWSNTTQGPVVSHTFTKNTTIIRGPDGKIIRQYTTTSVDGEEAGSGSRSGGSFEQIQTSDDEHSRVYGTRYQGSSRPKIIYTSSGSHVQQGRTDGGGIASNVSQSGRQDFRISGQHGRQRINYHAPSNFNTDNNNNINLQTDGNMYSSEEYIPEMPVYEGQESGQAGGLHDSRTQSGSRIRTYDGQNYGQSGRDRSTYGKYNDSWDADYARHGIGAAALGHGFKTAGFDLGTLGSNANVDESVSEQASRRFETSEQQQGRYDPDLGRVVYDSRAVGGGAHRSIVHSSGGSRMQGPQRQQIYSETQTSYTHDYPVQRDNVPTDKPDPHNRFVGRRKRQIIEDRNVDIKNIMECKATKCKSVRCTIGPMKRDQDAIIVLRSRLNIHTLQNITSSQSVNISSMMVARISKVPYIGASLQEEVYSHEIFTTVLAPEPDTKPDIVPLWVVVLSAVAGAIILLLLIFLLYKCGFFKRNRPSDAPERQPLNRNGHYHSGDEAL